MQKGKHRAGGNKGRVVSTSSKKADHGHLLVIREKRGGPRTFLRRTLSERKGGTFKLLSSVEKGND